MQDSLKNWIIEHKLSLIEDGDDKFSLEDFGTFLLLSPVKGNIIDKEFNLIILQENRKQIVREKIQNVLFQFGSRYYYTPVKIESLIETKRIQVKFNDFKHIGKVQQKIVESFAHLGVHSEYELMNGTHQAEDWVKKAKFLGHEALGICDENTLAGVLGFQIECKKKGIKPVLGMTAVVRYDNNESFKVKLYIRNKAGWRNILRINKAINVDNEGFVFEKDLLKYSEGLILVFTKDSIITKKVVSFSKSVIRKYKEKFDLVFYQFDTVAYNNSEMFDQPHLKSLQIYLNHLSDMVDPVLINDSYYLDREESKAKKTLNEVTRTSKPTSDDESYKNLDDSYNCIVDFFNKDKIFKLGDNFDTLWQRMLLNTLVITSECDFEINTGNHKLPKFEYEGNTLELFDNLLAKGMQDKIYGKVDNPEIYEERLVEEYSVIVGAGFVDYFLILWDVVRWAKENNIIVGNGRGSVVGSLLSMLLDITTVDPIEHSLLFERFINKTRVSGERAKQSDALPDIDIDFMASRRDEVKRYMEEKYGSNYVCSVGTFTRMKLKGAIKDFNRVNPEAISHTSVNYLTKMIDNQLDYEWGDLIKYAIENDELRKFVNKNPEMVNNIKFILNQPRSSSVHASAVLILPKTDEDGQPMTIYDWIPVRKELVKEMKEFVLVSEWEGNYISDAGFLKEDILGLKQLDKFKMMLGLIKKNHNKNIILEEIPLNDRKVYKLFSKGLTEEVFQFSSSGLKKYSKAVKPDTIEDIIAMNSLYRPGSMSSNAHMDYADIKHGKKEPEYDYGMEKITEKTFGLYIYQEIVMQAMVVAGFSLVDADVIRTIIKKFDREKMMTFKEGFIKGMMKIGCEKDAAEVTWNKLLAFSGYSFNKSHSAAYGIMAYWCQWLKRHYPMEFFTVCLNFADGDQIDIPNLINELSKMGLKITLHTPDINKSTRVFVGNISDNTIYWSLNKIKGFGDATTKKIIDERKSGSKFISLIDFATRMNGKGFGKDKIEKLILCGAFDKVEAIKEPKQRIKLLESFSKSRKLTLTEEYAKKKYNKNHNWLLVQKELIGYGIIDFKEVLREVEPGLMNTYVDVDEFMESPPYKKVTVAGKIVTMSEGNSKNGKYGRVTLLSNDQFIFITVWADVWILEKPTLEKAKKDKLLFAISGKVKFDGDNNGYRGRGHNVLYTDVNETKVKLL